MMNLAKLRGLRAEKRLTQKDLAEAIKMPLSTYCLKEQGKSKFKVDEVNKICNILEVDSSIFFTN